MPETAQLDVVINSIANTAGFAAARTELSALGGAGGVGGLGGFSGGATKEVTAAERDIAAESNAAARAMGALGERGAYAVDRLTALGGVLGSSGALGLGIGAAVIGLTGIFEISKSVVDNTEAQSVATMDLSQAYTYLHNAAVANYEVLLKQHAAAKALAPAWLEVKSGIPTKEIQDFIDQNERFIPSMFAAEEGFAQLARAGFNNQTQIRLMNDALDLSVVKHEDLNTAVLQLTQGSLGLGRGLLELGISQKDINAALGKGATEGEKFDALLKLLEPKIHGMRTDLSESAQASNRLNIEWQKLTANNQPLPEFIAAVENKLADFLNALANSDNGANSPWAAFQNGVIGAIQQMEALNQQLADFINNTSYIQQQQYTYNTKPPPPGTLGKQPPRQYRTS